LNDIKELIKKCHDLDIKILADFVPNHCSCELLRAKALSVER